MSQTDRVQTSVYFPKEIYADLVKWAEQEDRSVSNLVVRLVAKAIEEKESKWSRQLGKGADDAEVKDRYSRQEELRYSDQVRKLIHLKKPDRMIEIGELNEISRFIWNYAPKGSEGTMG